MTSYANPDALVDVAWVKTHRTDPDVRLVEIDVDTTAYDSGHIPGSLGWNWQTDLQQHPARDIPDQQEWETLLSRSGIAPDTQVILYGDNHNWFAAFGYWIFKYYGHDKVALLDGGRAKWLADGGETTTDIPTFATTQYRVASTHPELRAYRDDVKNTIGNTDTVLIDVRSPKEYSGELLAPETVPQEGAQRGGHVPGAQNVPWGNAVAADSTFKPVEELLAIYQDKGVTENKPAIAYCRIGERSAHTWFVLSELLGIPDARNYDGSWTEWGSLIGAPIER